MGYTKFTKQLVQGVIDKSKPKSVLDFGSANDYETGNSRPPFISEWYLGQGIKYTCIDLAGDNGALQLDVSHPLYPWEHGAQYDLVVDSGFSEHVVQMDGYETTAFHDGYIHSIYPTKVKDAELGFYNCWLNKWDLLRLGGIMVNENPLSGSWPGHGYHYYTPKFYDELEKIIDGVLLSYGEHPSSGNIVDGWNEWAIIIKTGHNFPTFEEFKKLPIQKA
jgi:hypothetical protein